MRMKGMYIAISMLTSLLAIGTAPAADQAMGEASSEQWKHVDLPNGVIGVSMHVGAERIGDPAVLYVAMVHPEGPAHQAGLAHGDEVLMVDGTAVAGKTYEQVVKMIRGTVGEAVKLEVKGESGKRELTITRVAADKLSKGPSGSHGKPSR